MVKSFDEQKLNSHEVRSIEVKEILGESPRWMIRWGITLIFIIITLLVVGSALIRYNDIVIASITITTKTPPVYIEARSSGKLANIFAITNQSLEKGDILAEIENTAKIEDVYGLNEKLNQFELNLITLDSLERLFPSDLKLGHIQQAYAEFVSLYQNYILFHSLEPNKKEVVAATIGLERQFDLLKEQENQLLLFKEELALSELNLNRNEALLDKGVIAKSEFESIARSYLADKQQYKNLESAISRTKIAIASMSGVKIQSSILDQERKYGYRQNLLQSLEILKSEIGAWELAYIIKSPMRGKLTMFDIRNRYQNVKQGDIIFTVVPLETDSLIGQVTMPVQNSGKVKIGQKVIIKLNNYPHQEWGSLNGIIEDISSVPIKGEALYSIQVKVDSLVTSFNKRLDFKQEMQGTAEIITEELSLLNRIFYQLHEVFSRN